MQALEFASGVRGGELPVDRRGGRIPARHPSRDRLFHGRPIGEVLAKTLALQYAQLEFRHVQPTLVLGRVTDLQLVGGPLGLIGGNA